MSALGTIVFMILTVMTLALYFTLPTWFEGIGKTVFILFPVLFASLAIVSALKS